MAAEGVAEEYDLAPEDIQAALAHSESTSRDISPIVIS